MCLFHVINNLLFTISEVAILSSQSLIRARGAFLHNQRWLASQLVVVWKERMQSLQAQLGESTKVAPLYFVKVGNSFELSQLFAVLKSTLDDITTMCITEAKHLAIGVSGSKQPFCSFVKEPRSLWQISPSRQ